MNRVVSWSGNQTLQNFLWRCLTLCITFFSLMLSVGLLSALKGKTEDVKFVIAKSGLYMVFVAYLNLQHFGGFYNVSFRSLTLGGILQLDHVTWLKNGHWLLLRPFCWKRFLSFYGVALKLFVYCYIGNLPHPLKLMHSFCPEMFAFHVNLM